MAYTTPTTRSTGNTITAAIWNADMVDNVKWVAGDSGGKPSCRVYNSANYAIANATQQAISFDSETRDNGGMHSTVSLQTRIVVPSGAAGFYLIGGHATFASNATGVRQLQIRVNGTTQIATSEVNSLSANALSLTVVTVYPLAVSDYVELMAYQTSGGNLDVQANNRYSPDFWAVWTGI
jgi:hypothetical protein